MKEESRQAMDNEELAVREVALMPYTEESLMETLEMRPNPASQAGLQQQLRRAQEEVDQKTSLGRKWEEQARRTQMERELKNREWSDKKLGA
jgi:hypothetical protein